MISPCLFFVFGRGFSSFSYFFNLWLFRINRNQYNFGVVIYNFSQFVSNNSTALSTSFFVHNILRWTFSMLVSSHSLLFFWINLSSSSWFFILHPFIVVWCFSVFCVSISSCSIRISSLSDKDRYALGNSHHQRRLNSGLVKTRSMIDVLWLDGRVKKSISLLTIEF